MAEQETGFSRLLKGFDRFSGGVEARRPEIVEAPHDVTQAETLVTISHINGEIPGEVAGVDFWIPLVQLQLAPAEDLLNSRYDPKEDTDFEPFTLALNAMGKEYPALPVLPANQNIRLPDGTEQTLYTIYDLPHIYYALVQLKRTHARVYIPSVTSPGAILLSALGREGQLRREPSMLEICRASRRLKEYYGCTLDEIAEQQANNREDKSRPSRVQIHYQINVAGLPEPVQDMLHRKQILWTHARSIAENFLGDNVLCEQLAVLASQGKRMNVDDLEKVTRRLKEKMSRLEQDEDGVVHEVRLGQTIQLVAGPAPKDEAGRDKVIESTTYDHTMVARAGLIHRESTRFTPVIVPSDKPEQVALAPSSFAALRDWVNERQTNTSVRDTEAVLLGFLQAVRSSARTSGLVNQQGVIAPHIDATRQAKES